MIEMAPDYRRRGISGKSLPASAFEKYNVEIHRGTADESGRGRCLCREKGETVVFSDVDMVVNAMGVTQLQSEEELADCGCKVVVGDALKTRTDTAISEGYDAGNQI